MGKDGQRTVDLVDPNRSAPDQARQEDVIAGDPLETRGADHSDAMVDEWGRQSFPASDPPSNW